MKATKIFGLILMLAVLLSVSAFAADPYKIDFESFDVGYEIAGDAMEDGFYREVNLQIKVADDNGNKVAAIDQTFPGFNNGFLRFYPQGTDVSGKPFHRWGNQFVMSYRVRLDVPEGANSLIFVDRVTDSKDNEGFEVLRVWHNTAVESADGQVANITFGEWHTITNNYDLTAATVTTYIDGEFAFTQPLPTTATTSVDWTVDFCYHVLGRNMNNDTNTGMIYLDDISWASGAYTPDQGGGDEEAPDTFDASIAVALVGLVAAGGAIVSKKRR